MGKFGKRPVANPDKIDKNFEKAGGLHPDRNLVSVCKVAVTDIKTQLHFLVTSRFVYLTLKHKFIGFLLATIKSSDLWGGFVASKKIITGLNNILYQIFSKY